MHSRLLKIAYWISNDRQLFSMPCLFDKYRVTSIIETHRQWQEESVRRVKEKIKEKSCTTYGRLCNQVGNSKKPQNYLMSPIMQFLCIFGTKCAQVLTYLWIKGNADSFCEISWRIRLPSFPSWQYSEWKSWKMKWRMLMNNTLFDILQLLLLGFCQRSRWQWNSRRIHRRISNEFQSHPSGYSGRNPSRILIKILYRIENVCKTFEQLSDVR